MEYLDFIFTATNPIQPYALIFLLGSLSVSSLSDLRRMAAQADFAEVWGGFTLLMFVVDIYLGLTSQLSIIPFILKWVMIAAFTAAASGARMLSISTMDVAAIAALLATLNPAYIILALILLALTNELLRPILNKYGEAGAYPFLPTVLAVNIVLLLILLAGGIEPYLGMTISSS